MSSEQERGEPLGKLEIEAELARLENSTAPEDRERRDALIDELITLDMSMGSIRRAMGKREKPADQPPPT